MKILRVLILFSIFLCIVSPSAMGGDFDWMKELNVQASMDPSGFRAKLATRFQVGDTKIGVVLSNMGDPASAYMAFRLAEMTQKPVEKVMEVCERNKGKGWGVIAKNLGIKPGSPEFHALKRGHDLNGKGGGKGKGKDKGKGKGKGKD